MPKDTFIRLWCSLLKGVFVIEKVEGKDETLIKLDEHGNALGGVRNPYVEYPLATYYGQSRPLDEESAFFCMLGGYKQPFDNDKIKSLYPTHEDYLNKVNAMVDKMVEERLLTESDGMRIKKEAQGINPVRD